MNVCYGYETAWKHTVYHLIKEAQCGRHYEVGDSECRAETLMNGTDSSSDELALVRLPRDPTGSTEDSPRKSTSWLDLHPLLCSLLF